MLYLIFTVSLLFFFKILGNNDEIHLSADTFVVETLESESYISGLPFFYTTFKKC